MLVLGIDPGLSGGLALIESGEGRRVVFAVDIPVMGVASKQRVHARGVLQILQKHKIDHAFIERAQAMPDQGSSSGFNYGRAVGALEACVEGMMIPISFVEPTAWKKTHGLTKPAGIDAKEWRKVVKENSRQRAILIYPACPFWNRKLDHGRAEAALIADHGLSILLNPVSPTSPARRKRPAPQLDLLDGPAELA